jgi:hypothetical protein
MNAAIARRAAATSLLDRLLVSSGWQSTPTTTKLVRLIIRLDNRQCWNTGDVCLTALLTRGCAFGHEWTGVGDLMVPYMLAGHPRDLIPEPGSIEWSREPNECRCLTLMGHDHAVGDEGCAFTLPLPGMDVPAGPGHIDGIDGEGFHAETALHVTYLGHERYTDTVAQLELSFSRPDTGAPATSGAGIELTEADCRSLAAKLLAVADKASSDE